MEKNKVVNISCMLEFEEENSDLSFDNGILDPDYCLPNKDNNDSSGIFVFNYDLEKESVTNKVVLREFDITDELCNCENIREPDIIDEMRNDDNITRNKRKTNKKLWKRYIL